MTAFVGVLVPETAVNENDLTAARKNQVWLARQLGAVKAETVAQLKRETAHQQFGRGILAANLAHVRAAPGW